VYLDFADAIQRLGEDKIRERYGNLFDMYERITGENAYRQPMRIFPAVHYAMGGLWVDYNMMSNVPGLFVLGEANFSDHGANRLGASALMQGLADGYFVIPYTIANYLAQTKPGKVKADAAEFKASIAEVQANRDRMLAVNGKKTVTEFMREVGTLMWNNVGMARSEASLAETLKKLPAIREEFWKNVKVTGTGAELNQQLENAGRTIDFIEFAELLARDAQHRNESCGGHFREEHQTPDGEAKRDDEKFAHVAAWEYKGEGKAAERHTEPLTFDNVHIAQRNYA
jgi:succinate dehydrogenase / fumarate reductase flavoprotein subunit